MANPAMWEAFNEEPERKLPRRDRVDKPRHHEKKKRKPIRTQSQAQIRRTAFLAGIKAERINVQITFGGGEVGCSRCPKVFTGFQNAWRGLDLHHDTKRSKGAGFRGGTNFGVDSPENLELVCRSCHSQLESNPDWSAA